MKKSLRLQAVLLFAGGALLGYAASQWPFTGPATASTTVAASPAQVAQVPPVEACPTSNSSSSSDCCSKGSSKAELLAASAKPAAAASISRHAVQHRKLSEHSVCAPSRSALMDSEVQVSLAALGGTPGSNLAALAVRNMNAAAQAQKSGRRPNILVIWGDDIGWFNTSAYHRGIMGYRTPNIDRIAKEGGLFTDWYGQQSCTAGRAAFITGQSPVRTGLTKVGLPGAKEGLQPDDPTIAVLLKMMGYVTGQFGKNHLGDLDAHLPTAHGFDEFYGNLYHLNAEEEPENPDYPKDPAFKKKFGPRGVIHSFAGGKITDTGPLTKKRMETIDEEVTQRALAFMDKAHKEKKPFFVWWNSTRMHIWTHLKKESEGKTGLGIYPDGMVEHDRHVGMLLKKLDDLGIADDTIVIYSTDNGAEAMSWPDGGTTPFRGEKNTNWEGGYRVPCLVRWNGVIPPGTIYNDIFAHEDWLPTLMAAVGEPNINQKLLKGYKVGERTYKVHIDGYNMLPFFQGKVKDSPRKEFIYWSDGGEITGLRYNNWKLVFMEQRAHGASVWREPFTKLRTPKIFNLRTDPFERADHEAIGYERWWIDHVFLIAPAQSYVGRWMQTFREFPPRQRPGSFNLDEVMKKLTPATPGGSS